MSRPITPRQRPLFNDKEVGSRICRTCKQRKDIADFSAAGERCVRGTCKQCLNERQRKRKQQLTAAGMCSRQCGRPAESGLRSCKQCADKQSQSSLKRQKARITKGKCCRCGAERDGTSTILCNRCCSANGIVRRKRDAEIKTEVFNAYGGFMCACCGETEVAFLTIDHVNNDGAEHRRQLKEESGSSHLYKWLRRNGYPAGFSVLCMNCNWGRYINGGICPHMSGNLNAS